MTTLRVDQIEICDRARVRDAKPKQDGDIVRDYAEAYQCGLILEPLEVFNEPGTERYIVADGEHRLLALRSAGIKEVEVRIHKGDEIDALDFAIDCNQTHGLRRSKKDKYKSFRRIMETKLKDKYRTDTELSEKLGVSKRTVSYYKAEWRGSDGGSKKAQANKKQARQSAAKNTNKLTDEQRKVAKQVRDSHKRELPAEPQWTKADEESYGNLLDAWTAATEAAQQQFIREHVRA